MNNLKLRVVQLILFFLFQFSFGFFQPIFSKNINSVSYTHLRAHETVLDLVCRLLLEKKKKKQTNINLNL